MQDDAFEQAGGGGQSLTDTVEEAVVTLIEMVRERPAVAAALLAALVGAALGLALANLTTRSRSSVKTAREASGSWLSSMAGAMEAEERAKRVSRRVSGSGRRARGGVGDLLGSFGNVRGAADLVPVVIQLLENPLVRSMIRNAVSRQFGRRA